MVESSESKASSLPYSTLIMGFLALSGLWAAQSRLSTARPAQQTAPSLPLPGEQNIDARLWQDPFAAWTEHLRSEQRLAQWESGDANFKLGRTVHRQLAKLRNARAAAAAKKEPAGEDASAAEPRDGGDSDRLLLLPVMVPGGPYTEDSETRRRQRVAVISALLSQGYVPASSELIGAFDFRSFGGVTGRWRTPVPYEWLERDPGIPRAEREGLPDVVLVLWVQERALGIEPVARAEQIAAAPLALYLLGLPDGTDGTTDERAEMLEEIPALISARLIGPSSSTTMASMVREVVRRREEVKIDIGLQRAIKKEEDKKRRYAMRVSRLLLRTVNDFLPWGLPLPIDRSRVDWFRGLTDRLRDSVDRESLVAALEEVFVSEAVTAPAGWEADVADIVAATLPDVGPDAPWETVADKFEAKGVASAREAVRKRVTKDIQVQQRGDRSQYSIRRLEQEIPVRERLGRSRAAEARVGRREAEPESPVPVADLEAMPIEPDGEAASESAEDRAPIGEGDTAALVGELVALRRDVIEVLSPRACIYSPRSTVPSKKLFTAAELKEMGGEDALVELFRTSVGNDSRQRMERVVCTDDVVVGALLDELARRGIDPRNQDHHVALIKENDSIYGRSIADVFADCIARDRIHEFGYLRGLDGQLPAAPSDSHQVEAVGSSFADAGGRGSSLTLVSPFGRNQLDKIRRLVGALAGKDRLRAVGIIGSDIYDKLLVLGALRSEFPDQVFFTMDLDARVVMAQDRRATQNLIVVSSFGMELAPSLQRDVIGYRDGHQSATHLAVLRALDVRTDSLRPDAELAPLLQPRVFEVGRTRAIELATAETRSPLHPPLEVRVRLRSIILWVAVLGMAAFALLGLKLRGIHRVLQMTTMDGPLRVLKGLLSLIAVLGVTVVGAYLANLFLHVGEPAYLNEGVSIWPTEFLRLLAAGMSIALIYAILAQTETGDKKLAARYFDKTLEPRQPRARWWQVRRMGEVKIPRRLLPRRDGDQEVQFDKDDLDALWAEYRRLGTPEHRFLRAGLPTLLLWVTELFVLLLPPAPLVPFRGEFAYWIDLVVTAVLLGALTLLATFTIDALRLAQAFVRTMSGATAAWPDTSYIRTIRESRGMPASELQPFLDILVIARQTKVYGSFLLFPFGVLILMVFSQFDTFDSWRWPLLFMALVGGLVATVLVEGSMLISIARKARRRSLLTMRQHLTALRVAPDDRADGYEMLVTDAVNVREGAFTSVLANPVFNALLVPSGGLGALSLLDLFNRALI